MLKPGLRTKLLILPRILDFKPFWLIIFVLELHELLLHQIREDLAKDDHHPLVSNMGQQPGPNSQDPG